MSPHTPSHRRRGAARVIVAVACVVLLVVGAGVAFMVASAGDGLPEPVLTRSDPPPPASPPAAPLAPTPTQPAASDPRPATPVEPKPPALVGEPYIVAAGRSPLPQPGETIRRPIKATTLKVVELGPAPAAGAIIPWDQAHQYLGHTITVEGRIVRTHNTGNICFLNFVPDHPSDAFYLVMFPSLFDAWPAPPEQYFKDKTVRVRGKVDLHRGKPQIRIQRRDQVLEVR